MIPSFRPKLSDLYTLSQSKLLESHTLHSGTNLYSPYMAVPFPRPGCVVRSWEKVCIVFEGLGPGIRTLRVSPYGRGEFRENERAFFPQGQSKLSNDGPGAPEWRCPSAAAGVDGGWENSGFKGRGWSTADKSQTKKKARTSNKKPKKSLDQKLTGPKNPNLKKKSKTDISDITRKIKSLEIEDHDCRASGGWADWLRWVRLHVRVNFPY